MPKDISQLADVEVITLTMRPRYSRCYNILPLCSAELFPRLIITNHLHSSLRQQGHQVT